MTKSQILKAIAELKKLDPKELRRQVMGAVLDLQVKLRNEGVEFETELGPDMYDQ